jgi:hypothetical protein
MKKSPYPFCSIEGCGKPFKAKLFCQYHYNNLRNHGDPSWTPPTPEERFWPRVNKNGPVFEDKGPCWIWMGKPTPSGYGQFNNYAYSIYRTGGGGMPHRYSYYLAFGEVDEGSHIDHLCRNRICVNPAHLEAVSPKVNVLRGQSPCAKNARKTHCPNGHEYSDDNIISSVRGRSCKKCRDMGREEALKLQQLVNSNA